MSNSDMWDACDSNGEEVDCIGEAKSCFTIERQSSQKQVTMVQMGCKQKKACLNNKYQNFWKGDECQRGEELENRSSKCYDCCNGVKNNSCNQSWLASYKAAADATDINSVEFQDSWKSKNGKY